jgi:hypothetical protein
MLFWFQKHKVSFSAGMYRHKAGRYFLPDRRTYIIHLRTLGTLCRAQKNLTEISPPFPSPLACRALKSQQRVDYNALGDESAGATWQPQIMTGWLGTLAPYTSDMHWSLMVMLCRSMAESTVKTSEDDSPSGKASPYGSISGQSYGTEINSTGPGSDINSQLLL